MKTPVVTINLPEGLPYWAYSEIVTASRVEGEVNVLFRFGDADHYVDRHGMTIAI